MVGLLIVARAFRFAPATGKPAAQSPAAAQAVPGFAGGLSGHWRDPQRSCYFELSRNSSSALDLRDRDRRRPPVGLRQGAVGAQLGQLGGVGAEVTVGIAAAIAGSWVGNRLAKKVTIGVIHQVVGVMLVVLGAGIAAGVV